MRRVKTSIFGFTKRPSISRRRLMTGVVTRRMTRTAATMRAPSRARSRLDVDRVAPVVARLCSRSAPAGDARRAPSDRPRPRPPLRLAVPHPPHRRDGCLRRRSCSRRRSRRSRRRCAPPLADELPPSSAISSSRICSVRRRRRRRTRRRGAATSAAADLVRLCYHARRRAPRATATATACGSVRGRRVRRRRRHHRPPR